MNPLIAKSGIEQYISFEIKDKPYGIDIKVVNEIYPYIEVSPVPLSEEYIFGMVNIRGQVVLIYDLAVILGQSKINISTDTHLIILKTANELNRNDGFLNLSDLDFFGERPVGFVVDRIGDVRVVSQDEILTAPPHIAPNEVQFLKGVVNLGKDILTLINAGSILKYIDEK